MILKKPYAFFIRFFKIFHLLIFALSSILLYRTSLIYDFMREFCKNSPNVVGKNLVSPLFSWWIYLLIIIIIAFNVLIVVILIRKTKPYLYYIINICLYVAVFVVFVASQNVIGDMQTMIISAKTTLAIRDFLNLARLFQTVSVVFYLIRATGFDIKKFDFVRDLQGLDISEEDSEEIEVAVEFEGNVILRNIRKNLRDYKYYYKENKFIINMFGLVLFGFLCLFIYFSFSKYDKVYNENQFVHVDSFNIGVVGSFIINSDFMGNRILSDDVLVAVKFSVNGGGILSSSKFVLAVNGMQYYPISGYDKSVLDFGTVYNNQSISSEFSDYLFVYKVPKSVVGSSFIFKCIESIGYKNGRTFVNAINIKLNPTNYIGHNVNDSVYDLGNEIIIDKYKVKVDSFDINKYFNVSYNSCVTLNECYDFKEVLYPSIVRNREKVLLKLNGSLSYDDSSRNLYEFISKFGSIIYVYNGKEYVEYGDFSSVISSKSSDSIYIEVNKEIKDASSIKLVFNFRDRKYSYILRGDNVE